MPTQTFDGEIRPLRADDRAEWAALYRQYRDFYRQEPDDRVIETTWRWLIEREHGLDGLVATDATGALAGLAHIRPFARPSSASIGIFLDDLFTAPAARGQGVASALLAHIAQRATDAGASTVRWITATDNATARSLYDRVATETAWVTYDMAPAPASTRAAPRPLSGS